MSGSLDYDIRFWYLSTGECCEKIDWISKEGHRGVIRALKADSWRVVSGADDKTIKVRRKQKSRHLFKLCSVRVNEEILFCSAKISVFQMISICK